MSSNPTIPAPQFSADPPSFFTAAPEAAALADASIPTTSALEQLGPSPFPKSGFPLLGFLESVYDHLSSHAARRLPPQ